MDKFLEKWKKDPKYRTKIKLLLYTLFVVLVAIYALTLDTTPSNDLDNTLNDLTNNNNNNVNKETTNEENILNLAEKYNYTITVSIDNEIYKYYGTKDLEQTTITKETSDKITNYMYKDNSYYVNEQGTYVITNKEEIYNVVSYNYINLDNINTYLNKATKDNDQYLVYLKDIILGEESDDYFVIIINNNKINIDYTPLMKHFNSNIKEYKVNIELEEIE